MARWLPWCGFAIGLAWALWDLATPRESIAPEPYAARVNGVDITRDRYFATLAALAVERGSDRVTDAQREQILEQLIDEELLVARALELDLPRRSPEHRKALVEAMREHVTSGVQAGQGPEEGALRAYYAEHASEFSGAPRYVVDWIFVRGSDARTDERAVRAASELTAGTDANTVRSTVGDTPLVPLPDGPLTESALRQYLGPTVARATRNLTVGGVSPPLRVAGGLTVVRLRERTAGAPPAFEEIRGTVKDILERKARADAIDAYLGDLRRASAIERSDAEFDSNAAIPKEYLDQARPRPQEQAAP